MLRTPYSALGILLVLLFSFALAAKRCPECGRTYQDEDNYCAECEDASGGPVRLRAVPRTPPATPSPQPPRVQPEPPRVQPEEMRYLQRNAQGYDEYLWFKDSSVVIRIPAGTFTMGSPEGEGESDERPQHQVYLDEYYIDKYEVTNRQYDRFVRQTGYRTTAESLGSGYVVNDSGSWTDRQGVSWRTFYNYSTQAHPVVLVSWADAQAYCTWAGKRLPTEAEWEKAARGTDARKYPWGNSEPGTSRNGNFADEAAKRRYANWTIVTGYDDGYVNTAPVGTFPSGASPYGCLDMAGNVWEWCNDWCGESYYGSSASNNPQGPSSGSFRVIRGGSWNTHPRYLRAANRGRFVPSDRVNYIGFRCCPRR